MTTMMAERDTLMVALRGEGGALTEVPAATVFDAFAARILALEAQVSTLTSQLSAGMVARTASDRDTGQYL